MPSQKQQQDRQHYVFGPVLSRRLGLSLGIDLVPFKTCTFDCIYCQLGRTTNKTLQRKEYVPVDEILGDLERYLKNIPRPDFITLSGSGEPTLHSGLRDIIIGIRTITTLPVAVLTNGSLFNDKDVREACSLADVVLPSLDAGDEDTFNKINRPAEGLTLHSLIDGLTDFWLDFGGRIWLEVFLVPSVTDNEDSVKKIARLTELFRPHWIHLNTAVRPSTEESVKPVSDADMKRFARFFKPEAQCVFSSKANHVTPGVPIEKLHETLKRRPCTLTDMAGILNVPPVEITKYIEEMMSEGKLDVIRHGENTYFSTRTTMNTDEAKE